MDFQTQSGAYLKKEFYILLKSVTFYRNDKYDSFYIIGTVADQPNTLLKFKYFSTKLEVFGHRGKFRIITKPEEPKLETYKQETISCYLIDQIYPIASQNESTKMHKQYQKSNPIASQNESTNMHQQYKSCIII